MVKYVKIEDEDIIEVEGEQYCWNCEYFVAPYGCCGIFGFVTPFHWCEDWSKANEKDIEENKDKIDECCVVNRLKSLKENIGLIKTHKKELNKSIDKILEIIEAVNND